MNAGRRWLKAPDLTASEARYLYRTLVDIILRIAESEGSQVLTFRTYSKELRHVYNKYVYNKLVRRYVTTGNLKAHIERACYVIRTEN